MKDDNDNNTTTERIIDFVENTDVFSEGPDWIARGIKTSSLWMANGITRSVPYIEKGIETLGQTVNSTLIVNSESTGDLIEENDGEDVECEEEDDDEQKENYDNEEALKNEKNDDNSSKQPAEISELVYQQVISMRKKGAQNAIPFIHEKVLIPLEDVMKEASKLESRSKGLSSDYSDDIIYQSTNSSDGIDGIDEGEMILQKEKLVEPFDLTKEIGLSNEEFREGMKKITLASLGGLGVISEALHKSTRDISKKGIKVASDVYANAATASSIATTTTQHDKRREKEIIDERRKVVENAGLVVLNTIQILGAVGSVFSINTMAKLVGSEMGKKAILSNEEDDIDKTGENVSDSNTEPTIILV